MAESTAIAWTDHTFNPWQGCEKVSPACDHCYAETLSKRVGHPERWGADGERAVTSDAYWRNPFKWDAKAAAAGRPALVFCASMADVFEGRRDLNEPRARLWDLIEATPHLIWLLLTKRPENVEHMVPARWLGPVSLGGNAEWPRNAWLGATVENQEQANARIPKLFDIGARVPVRFLSCEPLLGPIDLTVPSMGFHTVRGVLGDDYHDRTRWENIGRALNWVIVGGESGGGFRALDVDHARSLRDQCARAGVPFFFKQHGGITAKTGGHMLDGDVIQQFPAQAGR